MFQLLEKLEPKKSKILESQYQINEKLKYVFRILIASLYQSVRWK